MAAQNNDLFVVSYARKQQNEFELSSLRLILCILDRLLDDVLITERGSDSSQSLELLALDNFLGTSLQISSQKHLPVILV